MRIELDCAAKAEIRDAALFYNDCRQGLGEEFIDAVETALDQIVQHPFLWRVLKGRYRRYLVQRFPYGIIYTVEDDLIYVAAVMHLKRKPDYWEKRGR